MNLDELVRQHHAEAVCIAEQWAPAGSAEDVVQNAWIAALEHPDRVPDDPRHFMRWFVRVLRNQASNMRSGLQTGRTGSELEWRNRPLRDVYTVPPTADVACELQEMLEKMRGMVPGRRQMLLAAMQGYTHAEMAAEEGISEWGSRCKLRRARLQLRALCEGNE